VEREHWTVGLCSDLPDGRHILMWDFDESELAAVASRLASVQRRYELPTVYVLQTRPGHYHAYALDRRPWVEARSIVAGTPGIDVVWYGLCLKRGFFTLRIGPRGEDARPRPVLVLPGRVPDRARWEDLEHLSMYTTPKGG
jgi:hypothetical protein